jgi:hypothetical protein
LRLALGADGLRLRIVEEMNVQVSIPPLYSLGIAFPEIPHAGGQSSRNSAHPGEAKLVRFPLNLTDAARNLV